ncbi:MAG: hypothetical protein J6O55_02115 [Lachnospiraceae bacterium]|nr:hypothetical protein [Lachnospiraceae bacterium]
MELRKPEEYTVSDIYSLPNGERAELIDGRWYDMAAPGISHQRILGAIAGVREYWIINPDTRIINTYAFSPDEEREDANMFTFDEELNSAVFPDFSMVLSEEI